MTGKVIDSGANGALLLILPIAFAIIILFFAWQYFLGLFVLGLIWKLWKTYQWRQLSRKIDPIFNELVEVNQGCLTVLDISMKANLSASTGKWYLERKTEEYGAIRRLYEDRGIVYYFLTAKALGSIFDDSEPENEVELAPDSNPSVTNPSSVVNTQDQQINTISINSENEDSSTIKNEEKETILPNQKAVNSPSMNTIKSKAPPPDEIHSENTNSELNQSDLAKRLEVHSTTISKRKTEFDFDIWSQTKDPEGIAWQYLEEKKVFVPLEPKPESS